MNTLLRSCKFMAVLAVAISSTWIYRTAYVAVSSPDQITTQSPDDHAGAVSSLKGGYLFSAETFNLTLCKEHQVSPICDGRIELKRSLNPDVARILQRRLVGLKPGVATLAVDTLDGPTQLRIEVVTHDTTKIRKLPEKLAVGERFTCLVQQEEGGALFLKTTSCEIGAKSSHLVRRDGKGRYTVLYPGSLEVRHTDFYGSPPGYRQAIEVVASGTAA